MVRIDNKDKKILNILQNNYRISYKKLGNIVKMAASSVHNRVLNMINNGIIKKFDTLVDPFEVGYETIAILGLSVDPHKMNEIARKLAKYDEVKLVVTSTGDYDIILQIIEENEKELWRFINEKIKTIEGVKPQMSVSSFIDIFKLSHKINFKIDKKE